MGVKPTQTRGILVHAPGGMADRPTITMLDRSLALLDSLLNDVATGGLAGSSLPHAAPQQPTAAKPDKPTKPAKPAQPQPTAAKPAVAKAKAAATAKPDAPPPKAVAPPTAAGDGAALPATDALYQTDTYLFTSEATVLAVLPLESSSGWYVVLDSTCFHPQGGGQPADTGTITSIEGGAPFEVAMCKKDPTGVVRHEGGQTAPAFQAGSRVRCVVAEAGRRYNARVHSAGHLIDVAMSASGCTLKPTKGYHFTPGAYVEYEGKLDAAERDAIFAKLQAAMDGLVAQGVPTVVQQVDAQQLDTVCPLNALPADRALWGKGWVRVVDVGGQGCPCGGTHVKNTAELGKVKVEALKSKGKVTRVSYTVEQ